MSKIVDTSSLVVDGVSIQDFPDFCDAYIAAGSFTDGTEMSEDDLDTFNEESPEVAQEMALESLLD